MALFPFSSFSSSCFKDTPAREVLAFLYGARVDFYALCDLSEVPCIYSYHSFSQFILPRTKYLSFLVGSRKL